METSFGVIPLRRTAEGWLCLLVQHKEGGHWSFPKGHPLPEEGSQQTAERELREETGLSVGRWLPSTPWEERYTFVHQGVMREKLVTYFTALVEGEVALQAEELSASRWLSLKEAEGVATFPPAKAIIRGVSAWLAQASPQL